MRATGPATGRTIATLATIIAMARILSAMCREGERRIAKGRRRKCKKNECQV